MASLHNNLLSNRIVQKDWIQLHPLKIQSPSDFYYIQLSNKILFALDKDKYTVVFAKNLKRQFALTAAAYFEDVISSIGLWRAIRQINFKKQGRYIPFINSTEDYQLDEINPEDIQFLIWTLVQRNELEQDKDTFINIENPIVSYVCMLIYEILDAEYENAPENEVLYNVVHSANLVSDYFLFREFLKWLHYDSYLSCSYPKIKLQDELEGSKTNQFYKENKDVLKYTLIQSLIFTDTCSPIAIHAAKWLAEIVTDPLVKHIAQSIEYKPFANYRITDTNNKTLKIKLLDGGIDIFELNLNSLTSTEGIKNKTLISCAMTFFNGLWNVNGMASFNEDDDLQAESIDQPKSKMTENSKLTYEFILKKNKNSPVVYFRDAKELSVFLLKHFPNSTKKELIPSNMISYRNIVAFTHPNFGLIMYPELAELIKDKNNPYYNKQSATDHAISILCGGGFKYQREFLEYLIQNNLIPDAHINSLNGEEYGRKLVQDNLDFIVRFFQPELFATKID